MAQQERAVITRRAVLEAAGEVFAERGYGAATISDVYTRAGVTKGAFYFHFPSKEELAQEVLDGQVSGQVGHLGTAGPRSGPVKLQGVVDSALLVAYRLTFDKLLQGSIRLSIDLGNVLDRRRPYGAWVEHQVTVLSEAKAQGELLPHVEVAPFARVLVGAFSGVQLMSEVMTGRRDVEQEIATLYSHLMPSVAVPAVLAQLDISPDLGRRLMAETVRDEGAQEGS
ncbi:TetR/AcrR family transcriptional regulator [Streptomyces sp. N2-109]|uniref:TetR/AcrR family transcriptional regulator n=1 Tax=Streptomyces gossypii TaxID=2883101 RepID=A0ABT2K3R4_9ACTN|nr:ScbR family autoregulator-binding transcription factor [Streptomyces gossypii]MCT2594736.1 TetR/AcrR family transcriptional regulator [Streptomyces gossypii]